MAFSPDGAQLATAGYDRLIKLWDVATAKEIRTLRDHIDAIYALEFTPDGKRIVTGAADRSVKIWDVATGGRLYTMSESTDGGEHDRGLARREARRGGQAWTRRFASGGSATRKATLENTLIAHEDAILKLAWSPDGKLLASASADRSVKIFRAADLTEIRAISKLPDWAFGLQFAPAGDKFAAGFFNGNLAKFTSSVASR